jgi:DNA helicase-2/ATP-dependent DNA helicase PcrA
MNLNEAQSRAAKTQQGPILILAGAGAGKTMTLTARIINLIESGVLPQNILAITFTNKAAAEMKERVYSSIMNNRKINFAFANDGFLPFVSTFHSLGVFILRENYEKLDISKYFTIYDSADSKKAFREALKTLNLDPKE